MNFLALLRWAPDGETTIMSPAELVERFSLDRVGASPATLDYAKLDWMNGVYPRARPWTSTRSDWSNGSTGRASTGRRNGCARPRRWCREDHPAA